MCRYNKILLKITGSVAAYKSADLASKLVQKGFEVQVVATAAALKFVGKATFEAITGKQVFTDSFEEGKMMSHIHLVRWADMVVIAPASANTINKFASGIADNLVTSLFLAHDLKKPYLVVPAMNTSMLLHPATQKSIRTLKEWGIQVMDTESGRLACGEIGAGKFPDTEAIITQVRQLLDANKKEGAKTRKVLITSGGTIEKIDEVREVRNISTGKTGATIADCFIQKNWEVTFLHSEGSSLPSGVCTLIPFTDFDSLQNRMKDLLGCAGYHSVIHLAAVSDYSVRSFKVNEREFKAPFPGKLDSSAEEMILNLRRNPKILSHIKGFSTMMEPLLVAFKFTSGSDEISALRQVMDLKRVSGADLIVWNDAQSRLKGRQTGFTIYSGEENPVEKWTEPEDLANRLEVIISEKLIHKT
jgi:phosphopantothenoylcysteine decarboxylase/phosphopantothenate--cysteine ligase